MANAELLWETFDEILAYRELWNQKYYILGRCNPAAQDWHECGTTQCLAGFQCFMDGLRPWVDEKGWADGSTFVDSSGELYDAEAYAIARFELTPGEVRGLLHCYTDDTAVLKERIQEVIDGKWRNEPRWAQQYRADGE